jgi:molybdopterin-guanine dinucleotide biosynthesis protein A
MMGVTAVVLAGGEGRRMGGADKGLVEVAGRPLVAWVLERIAPQVDDILISANRSVQDYEAYGHPVLGDDLEGFHGPLAGIQRALRETRHELLLVVPCDVPLLPESLVEKLKQAMATTRSDIAMACVEDNCHPTVALMRTSVAQSLDDYLAAGRRKVGAWEESLNYVKVDFDDAVAFTNANTPEDVKLLTLRLSDV